MEERLVHITHHRIETPGLSYHVKKVTRESTPDGASPLLMLHGFAGSSQSMIHLAKHLCGHRSVYLIDLAGHGQSLCANTTDPVVRYSSKKQIEDLKRIINHLKLQNITLYGYSMGGRLALQFLVDEAFNDSSDSLVKSAVLESTTCGIVEENQRSERRKADNKLARQIREEFGTFVETWDDKPVFKTSTPPDTELQALSRHIRSEQQPEHLAASLTAFGTGAMPCVCGKLKNLKIPIQFITGEEDHKFTEIASSMMPLLNPETRSESTHHIIPKTGHRIHLEKPEQIIDLLKKA
ncbi:MAG: alpha/beta fold hydrolase [Balneolia bacterium]|nr:alpha/beta fold hydrolase [Balneolia bacterium]